MLESNHPGLIAVVGPTGSGKSALALYLAQELGGEIVCTDSMQVYQKLNIGTAKPTAAEQSLVPHHQLDLIAPDGYYSAGRYEKDANRIIAKLQQQHKPVILVGGSGLYFRCAIFGICPIPDILPHIKKVVRQWHSQGLPYCYQKLQQLDPTSASALHPSDSARILRALEVQLQTGRSIQVYQREHGFKKKKYSVFSVGYWYNRKQLYQLINQRTLAMLKAGFVEEVRSLLKEYPSNLRSLQSIGYQQIVRFLDNRLTEDEMVAEIQQKTRNYAKRQLSWLRNDKSINWYSENEDGQILKDARNFFHSHQC